MIIWLVVAVALLIVEITIPILVSVWFMIGALLASVVAMLGYGTDIQIIVFLITSIILMLLTRPLAKKMLKKNKAIPTNKDILIGAKGIVIETIDNLGQTGRIKLDGIHWTVFSEDDSIIEVDSIVEVIEVDGVKLKVKKGVRK